MAAKLKIRKGDRVVVLTGKDKGKSGDVVAVIAEGKPRCRLRRQRGPPPPASDRGQEGGIVSKEMPIHLSNLALSTRRTARPPASVSDA
jgi:large subunit ribosomal protein L24